MSNSTQTAIDYKALDEEIAIKVMGWEKPPRDQVGWVIDGVWTGVRDYYCDWSPMTDIKAAWEVFNKFDKISIERVKEQYKCTINIEGISVDDAEYYSVTAETPALAISLTALAATKQG